MKPNPIIKFLVSPLFLFIFGCSNDQPRAIARNEKDPACCDTVNCKASKELSCKLTSPGLQKRKETVIAELKASLVERKELPNGIGFKFKGDDLTLDKLTEFIKTERACCDFFSFNLSVAGDQSEIWLELTGAEGVKDFIKTELEM